MELVYDRRCDAHANVNFLKDVVVNECKLDVLVSPTLAALGIDFAEQIKLSAIDAIIGYDSGRIGFNNRLCGWFGRCRGVGLRISGGCRHGE